MEENRELASRLELLSITITATLKERRNKEKKDGIDKSKLTKAKIQEKILSALLSNAVKQGKFATSKKANDLTMCIFYKNLLRESKFSKKSKRAQLIKKIEVLEKKYNLRAERFMSTQKVTDNNDKIYLDRISLLNCRIMREYNTRNIVDAVGFSEDELAVLEQVPAIEGKKGKRIVRKEKYTRDLMLYKSDIISSFIPLFYKLEKVQDMMELWLASTLLPAPQTHYTICGMEISAYDLPKYLSNKWSGSADIEQIFNELKARHPPIDDVLEKKMVDAMDFDFIEELDTLGKMMKHLEYFYKSLVNNVLELIRYREERFDSSKLKTVRGEIIGRSGSLFMNGFGNWLKEDTYIRTQDVIEKLQRIVKLLADSRTPVFINPRLRLTHEQQSFHSDEEIVDMVTEWEQETIGLDNHRRHSRFTQFFFYTIVQAYDKIIMPLATSGHSLSPSSLYHNRIVIAFKDLQTYMSERLISFEPPIRTAPFQTIKQPIDIVLKDMADKASRAKIERDFESRYKLDRQTVIDVVPEEIKTSTDNNDLAKAVENNLFKINVKLNRRLTRNEKQEAKENEAKKLTSASWVDGMECEHQQVNSTIAIIDRFIKRESIEGGRGKGAGSIDNKLLARLKQKRIELLEHRDSIIDENVGACDYAIFCSRCGEEIEITLDNATYAMFSRIDDKDYEFDPKRYAKSLEREVAETDIPVMVKGIVGEIIRSLNYKIVIESVGALDVGKISSANYRKIVSRVVSDLQDFWFSQSSLLYNIAADTVGGRDSAMVSLLKKQYLSNIARYYCCLYAVNVSNVLPNKLKGGIKKFADNLNIKTLISRGVIPEVKLIRFIRDSTFWKYAQRLYDNKHGSRGILSPLMVTDEKGDEVVSLEALIRDQPDEVKREFGTIDVKVVRRKVEDSNNILAIKVKNEERSLKVAKLQLYLNFLKRVDLIVDGSCLKENELRKIDVDYVSKKIIGRFLKGVYSKNGSGMTRRKKACALLTKFHNTADMLLRELEGFKLIASMFKASLKLGQGHFLKGTFDNGSNRYIVNFYHFNVRLSLLKPVEKNSTLVSKLFALNTAVKNRGGSTPTVDETKKFDNIVAELKSNGSVLAIGEIFEIDAGVSGSITVKTPEHIITINSNVSGSNALDIAHSTARDFCNIHLAYYEKGGLSNYNAELKQLEFNATKNNLDVKIVSRAAGKNKNLATVLSGINMSYILSIPFGSAGFYSNDVSEKLRKFINSDEYVARVKNISQKKKLLDDALSITARYEVSNLTHKIAVWRDGMPHHKLAPKPYPYSILMGAIDTEVKNDSNGNKSLICCPFCPAKDYNSDVIIKHMDVHHGSMEGRDNIINELVGAGYSIQNEVLVHYTDSELLRSDLESLSADRLYYLHNKLQYFLLHTFTVGDVCLGHTQLDGSIIPCGVTRYEALADPGSRYNSNSNSKRVIANKFYDDKVIVSKIMEAKREEMKKALIIRDNDIKNIINERNSKSRQPTQDELLSQLDEIIGNEGGDSEMLAELLVNGSIINDQITSSSDGEFVKDVSKWLLDIGHNSIPINNVLNKIKKIEYETRVYINPHEFHREYDNYIEDDATTLISVISRILHGITSLRYSPYPYKHAVDPAIMYKTDDRFNAVYGEYAK